MEINIKDYVAENEIVALVHFTGSFFSLKNSSNISYILDIPFRKNIYVRKYLEEIIPSFSYQKFQKACKMVLLDESVFQKNLKYLSRTECKKLRFILALLSGSKILVFQDFEQGFYKKERSYYQKLFKKLTKYGKSILYITNDVSFLIGLVSEFILFGEKKQTVVKHFYDKQIYEHLDKPEVVSFVEYLGTKGIMMEPYIEMKEVLKAIYRDVSAGEKH